MAKLVAESAVYGALPNGNQNNAKAFDVRNQLQRLMEENAGIVKCDNNSFGDPAPGFQKHFGAVVFRDGEPRFFACQEGQTIDFNRAGGVKPNPTITARYAVYGALINGVLSDAKAYDVVANVQAMLGETTVVTCNNALFGDPAPGYTKHFAAVITRGGQDYYYACQEGQTINFAQGGTA